MIKRIRQINQVGCYIDCRSSGLEFNRMTLLYGENCYGKSTLCDIFRSLSENHPNYITKRETIPADPNNNQNIQISIVHPNQTNETPYTFQNGNWQTALNNNVEIAVFDTEFIHRNLFTGLTIERTNTENITRFVLGDTGVQTAQNIAELNSELRALTKQIKDIEQIAFRGIPNLEIFLQMSPQESIEPLNRLFADRKDLLDSDTNLLSNSNSALQRREFSLLPLLPNINEIISVLESNLTSTYSTAHADAEKQLAAHLQNHTKNIEHSRNWVREGSELIKDGNCPFCGQSLKESNIISIYQAIFDKAFNKYISDTKNFLNNAHRNLQSSMQQNFSLFIEQNNSVYFLYPELHKLEHFIGSFSTMQSISQSILDNISELSTLFQSFGEQVSNAIHNKFANIHASSPMPEYDDLLRNIENVNQHIAQYNHHISELSQHITHFKSGLNTAALNQRIAEHNEFISNIQLQIKRITLVDQCTSYQTMVNRKGDIETELARLQSNLEQEQSEFLAQYFETINRIFSSLGSRRFSISAVTNKRGNMPTLQLKVAFDKHPITQDRLHTCFSESDRRALALSIFWAKLQVLDIDTRNKSIVILDDPVTSFDDSRIDRTIRLIEADFNSLRQVIILSHYSAYLKNFFTRINGQSNEILLASLSQGTNGTQIVPSDPLNFVESDHERAFRRIFTFINRDHTEDIFLELRVFLEQEVRSRFHRNIIMNNWRAIQFSNLINELHNINLLSDETRGRLDALRTTLNTDHHTWLHRTDGEKVGIAEDVLNFIYENL